MVPYVMQLVRPVMNVTDAVQVQFKLKISQLIDVVSLSKIRYSTRYMGWYARDDV
jgi:hypothetical protein